MGLQDQIDNDLKQALKGQKELELSVLRMVKTALKNAEIATKKTLTDDEALKVLSSQAKQRKDSIDQFQKAGRDDLVKKEEAELGIIQAYLPEQMSEEDIRKIVKEKIDEAGGDLNFGKIMGMVMGAVGQKADGQMVRKIVQEEMDK